MPTACCRCPPSSWRRSGPVGDAIAAGLTLSGHFLHRHLPDERRRDLYAARDRLVSQVRALGRIGTPA